MNIIITARGFDVTDNIKTYVERSVQDYITKFFADDSTVSVKVTLSKDANLFNSTISISDIKSEFIRISKTSDTAYHAIDNSIDYLRDKLQKHKTEKINKYRHNKNSVKAQMKCFGYVFDSNRVESYNVDNGDGSGLVIEEDVMVKTMTIGDAIMEMELLSLPALLFINVKNNRVNMIYTNSSGNVVWVDPLNISAIK
ncbi:ribosome hibernation-promoting factor, HPF/YfiA family [Ehrlichia canis]|uniref:Sigma 54 modulation protein/ribosomal protein S30EA n=1 Tax=Ehrlichia canis (strain Jake) TaxID=269484 RepID=A0ACA6AVU3_EHRCJ|nr:ribosome-associated translation inhibitor RaiA [Ehrlichia canis]AAZ68429.1 Sigma 54 modulation protein/ribosomal protein S30EA [Ehrlichia canis str. Jake]UKC53594.1 raiA [Ehrlichia canis]UKC54532.1 raiA [Ehrlichia canis]UKC55468.1 raiA [Ehrlichia canis]